MSISDTIDDSTEASFNELTIEEYEKPQFGLKDIECILPDKTIATKDIQNYITRGFVIPAFQAPKKNKKFSIENIVHIAGIGYLVITNPVDIASQIGRKIADRGRKLITERKNLFLKWKNDDFWYYLYCLKGNEAKGVFIEKTLLGDVIAHRKTLHKLQPFLAMDQRLFSGEELIFQVLLEYIKYMRK